MRGQFERDVNKRQRNWME